MNTTEFNHTLLSDVIAQQYRYAYSSRKTLTCRELLTSKIYSSNGGMLLSDGRLVGRYEKTYHIVMDTPLNLRLLYSTTDVNKVADRTTLIDIEKETRYQMELYINRHKVPSSKCVVYINGEFTDIIIDAEKYDIPYVKKYALTHSELIQQIKNELIAVRDTDLGEVLPRYNLDDTTPELRIELRCVPENEENGDKKYKYIPAEIETKINDISGSILEDGGKETAYLIYRDGVLLPETSYFLDKVNGTLEILDGKSQVGIEIVSTYVAKQLQYTKGDNRDLYIGTFDVHDNLFLLSKGDYSLYVNGNLVDTEDIVHVGPNIHRISSDEFLTNTDYIDNTGSLASAKLNIVYHNAAQKLQVPPNYSVDNISFLFNTKQLLDHISVKEINPVLSDILSTTENFDFMRKNSHGVEDYFDHITYPEYLKETNASHMSPKAVDMFPETLLSEFLDECKPERIRDIFKLEDGDDKINITIPNKENTSFLVYLNGQPIFINPSECDVVGEAHTYSIDITDKLDLYRDRNNIVDIYYYGGWSKYSDHFNEKMPHQAISAADLVADSTRPGWYSFDIKTKNMLDAYKRKDLLIYSNTFVEFPSGDIETSYSNDESFLMVYVKLGEISNVATINLVDTSYSATRNISKNYFGGGVYTTEFSPGLPFIGKNRVCIIDDYNNIMYHQGMDFLYYLDSEDDIVWKNNIIFTKELKAGANLFLVILPVADLGSISYSNVAKLYNDYNMVSLNTSLQNSKYKLPFYSEAHLVFVNEKNLVAGRDYKLLADYLIKVNDITNSINNIFISLNLNIHHGDINKLDGIYNHNPVELGISKAFGYYDYNKMIIPHLPAKPPIDETEIVEDLEKVVNDVAAKRLWFPVVHKRDASSDALVYVDPLYLNYIEWFYSNQSNRVLGSNINQPRIFNAPFIKRYLTRTVIDGNGDRVLPIVFTIGPTAIGDLSNIIPGDAPISDNTFEYVFRHSISGKMQSAALEYQKIWNNIPMLDRERFTIGNISEENPIPLYVLLGSNK